MFLLPESPFMLLRNYSFLQGMLCFGVEALKDIRQILLLVTGQLEWFI